MTLQQFVELNRARLYDFSTSFNNIQCQHDTIYCSTFFWIRIGILLINKIMLNCVSPALLCDISLLKLEMFLDFLNLIIKKSIFNPDFMEYFCKKWENHSIFSRVNFHVYFPFLSLQSTQVLQDRHVMMTASAKQTFTVHSMCLKVGSVLIWEKKENHATKECFQECVLNVWRVCSVFGRGESAGGLE